MADAIGNVIGAFVGADAAKDAAGTQADAANNATAAQKQMFEIINRQQAGFRNRGESAGNLLATYLGIPEYQQGAASTEVQPGGVAPADNFDAAAYLKQNPDVVAAGMDPWLHYMKYGRHEGRQFTPVNKLAAEAQGPTQNQLANPVFGSLLKQFTGADLQNEPGYQFGLNQGQQAIDRSAAARGGLYSGATAKALTRFGQDYGGTKFDAAFNRDASNKAQTYNFLSNTAGLGQVANAQTANAGMNYANQAGSNMIGAGNAAAAAGLAQGNIWGNAINSASAYGKRNGWFDFGSGSPNAFGGANSAGFGSGAGFGNEDLGQFLSDVRLKKNIRPIGRTPRGNTLYAWDWKTGGSGRGVIAQEVQHIPGAVVEDADGLLMVDYSKV